MRFFVDLLFRLVFALKVLQFKINFVKQVSKVNKKLIYH